MIFRQTLLAAVILLFSTIASAQPGALDASFNPNDLGFGQGNGASDIRCVVIQPDGRIIVGGSFSTYNSLPRKGITRMDMNGNIDPDFDPGTGIAGPIGPAPFVNAVLLQPDGKILAGGSFSSFNTSPINSIVRMASDGSPDPTFDPGSGAGSSSIRAMALQPDGKVLIAGDFIAFNGSPFNRICRLNADGSLDGTFLPGTGADGQISSMVLLPDGKIIIGGAFNNYNGTQRKGIARLDAGGALDATFSAPISFIPDPIDVSSLVVQPDGKVLFGVSQLAQFLDRSYGRMNLDGTLDESFALINNYVISAMGIEPDGDVLLAIGGGVVKRVDAAGTLDTGFNISPVPNASVKAVAVQANGRIILGGTFNDFGGRVRVGVARSEPDGTLDQTFNAGTSANNEVYGMAIQSDGKLILSGIFSNYNDSIRKNLVRIEEDGELDLTFDPGASVSGGVIEASLVQPDGKIIIAGSFNTYNGIPRSRIARLNTDGTLDTTFDPGTGATLGSPTVIHTMALLPDGKLLVAGQFAMFNGSNHFNIARLEPDGTPDSFVMDFPGVVLGPIYSVALQSDGKVIFAYRQSASVKVARLLSNGAVDASFNIGSATAPTTYTIRSIFIQPDGKIIVGGRFDTFNSISRPNLVRLNADGTVDNTFDPGTGTDGTVHTIAMQVDGKFMIGGDFTTYDGAPSGHFLRLLGTGARDDGFDTGSGADGVVNSILVRPDQDMYIAGAFVSYDGTGRNRVAGVLGGNSTGVPTSGNVKVQHYPWPNPTRSILYLPERTSGSILNTDGRIVQRFTSRTSIDIGSLVPGSYMIRTNQGGTMRFVKE